MNRMAATSRCECQATLTATLDEQRHVLHGKAKRQGVEERAPAHSIHAELEHFDIAWLCPFCGRNTMRTFYAGALRKLPAESAPALPAAEAAPKAG
jgi:hypothetical protein